MNITETLKQARETYGTKNQILVCIEELNELACVLAKYPRYDNEDDAKKKLHDAVLDEVADVTIILDHIQNILELTDEEILDRIQKKVSRLERWLESSNSMQQTVDDRAVEEVPQCSTCVHDYSTSKFVPSSAVKMCNICKQAESTEGIKPYYKPRTQYTTREKVRSYEI